MARGPTHCISNKPLRASLSFFLTWVCTRPSTYVPYVQLSFLHCFYFVSTLKLGTVFLIVIGTYLFLVQVVGHSLWHNQGPMEIATEHSKLIMHGAESLKHLKDQMSSINVNRKCSIHMLRVPWPNSVSYLLK